MTETQILIAILGVAAMVLIYHTTKPTRHITFQPIDYPISPDDEVMGANFRMNERDYWHKDFNDKVEENKKKFKICPNCQSSNSIHNFKRLKGSSESSSKGESLHLLATGYAYYRSSSSSEIDTLKVNVCKDCGNEWEYIDPSRGVSYRTHEEMLEAGLRLELDELQKKPDYFYCRYGKLTRGAVLFSVKNSRYEQSVKQLIAAIEAIKPDYFLTTK